MKPTNGTLDTEAIEDLTGIAETPTQVRCGLGVVEGVITFTVGEYSLKLTPEQADDLSADLRKYAIEVRHGGRLG